ncbi:aminoglycoside phosphotransferase [Kribbella flavida DSM 17836]|uniref:Aminoglycoside phosphotransferase n=1 Tax=Kribbella flavida (strain DSM 17836 / JCM 10339 / NBRC 14399) TaxID=479435 RepID=D2PN45_KRIFD|nr:aminoglycoside phosphotransferase [Kribbella flavida DSM 17836]
MLPVWIEAVESAVLKSTGAPDREELAGELLRQWGSSEVWRLSYGLRSVIAKRGSDAQAGEGTAYERFVRPLRLPAPELIDLARTDDAVLLVLADVGRVTLELEPSAEGFLASVDLLAQIRSAQVAGESDFGPERVLELADRIGTPAAGLRDAIETRLRPALADLHRDVPAAVVHGDFVPKNLVTDGTRWTAVDWPLAHLAPQLSDLYTLLRDAVALGHDREPLINRYCEAAAADPELVHHQTLLGGCTFVLRALSWVVEEGVHTVPSSTDWIAPLATELEDLLGNLR